MARQNLLRTLLPLALLTLATSQPQIQLQNDVTLISPTSPLYKTIADAALSDGVARSSNCGGADQNIPVINACRRRCLFPEQAARGECCCSVNSFDQLFVGAKGGCTFGHQLVLVDDVYVLESFSEAFGGIGDTCGSFVTRPECRCYQRWDIPREDVILPSIDPAMTVVPFPTITPALPSPPSPADETTPPGPPVTPGPDLPTLPAPPAPTDGGTTPTDGAVVPTDGAVVPTDGAVAPTDDVVAPTDGAVVPTDDVTDGPVISDGPMPTDDDGNVIPPGPVLPSVMPLPTASMPASVFVEPTETPEEEDESPTESEDDGSVCVDEMYLKKLGYSDEHLVHEGGIVAEAFCPGGTVPCGTAFHQVRHEGVAMSYRQLCERVSCERRTIRVNSVYSHLWQERVHGDVALTMYDVRYFEMPQRLLHWGMSLSRNLRGGVHQ